MFFQDCLSVALFLMIHACLFYRNPIYNWAFHKFCVFYGNSHGYGTEALDKTGCGHVVCPQLLTPLCCTGYKDICDVTQIELLFKCVVWLGLGNISDYQFIDLCPMCYIYLHTYIFTLLL